MYQLIKLYFRLFFKNNKGLLIILILLFTSFSTLYINIHQTKINRDTTTQIYDQYIDKYSGIPNNSKEKKVFDLYFYNKPFINLTWHGPYSKAYFDKHYNSLVFSHIGYDLSEKNQVLMLKSNIDFKSFEVSDINFKGIIMIYLHQKDYIKIN